MNRTDMKIWENGTHFCVRDGCRTETPADRGFCGPCVEWLESRIGVDPVAPADPPKPATSPESWTPYQSGNVS